jgi:hypothetical protein
MKASALIDESVLLVLVAWCAWDALLELTVGNEWTISWNLLGLESHHPIFAVLLVYTLNSLGGHLTMPHFGAVAPWVEWILVPVGIAPIAVAFAWLGFHPGGTDVAADQLRQFLHGGNEWRWYGVLCIAAILGLLNGKVCVPQHVF